MRILKLLAVAVVAGYLVLAGALYSMQRSMLFPAPPDGLNAGDPRRIDVPGGTHLFVPEALGDGVVLVHFHGNADAVSRLTGLASAWRRAGASFVAVEYPGYGAAPGAPSEKAILEAAETALKFLVEKKGIARDRIVLEGRSLGTGVAVAMAARGWGRRLVLVTPYLSISEVAAPQFPLFPVRLLIRDPFDSSALASQIRIPTLIVHGTHDRVIPFEHGRQLATQITGARFIEVPGADHDDVIDPAPVWNEITQFVLTP